MKKIPNNVPVFIQDLKSEENARYSTAKLKVFYQGETADHRLFTKAFSDKIIETLPSTPVVGFYSEEDEDFKGHNNVQYVYGHVPETATIEYVKDEESGNTFVVTDVILYTERKDNIGEVAKKIVGKQHSLELDPDTLKYKINRDINGKFLNIEFIDGQFIGLSVLGDNETPAFTGSGFFTMNENFKEFAASCHNNFDKFLNYLNNSGGEIQVFNSEEFFSKTGEFLAKTMQEFQSDIYAALDAMGVYGYICENTENYAVIYQYDPNLDSCAYLKYSIEKTEEGKLSLNNPVIVKAKFLTDEQIQLLEANGGFSVIEDDKNKEEKCTNTEKDENKGECAKDEEDKKGESEDDKDSNTDDNKDPEDDPEDLEKKRKCASTAEDDKNKGADDDTTDPQQKEEEKDKDKVGNATTDISAAALLDEERAELENYRKAAKIAIIDSYSSELDETILNVYRIDIDKYSKDEIEAKLAIEYRNFIKSKKATPVLGVTAFQTITTAAESYNEYDPAAVIKKYNKK